MRALAPSVQFPEEVTKSINYHEELPQLPLHQHLADEFQAFLACGPDEAYFLEVGLRGGLFNVLGVVEGF